MATVRDSQNNLIGLVDGSISSAERIRLDSNLQGLQSTASQIDTSVQRSAENATAINELESASEDFQKRLGFVDAFNFPTMSGGWKQYQLYEDNNEAQFIIKKDNGQIELGVDSDNSDAKNLSGHIRVYNGNASVAGTTPYEIDRPFVSLLDGDSSGGVVTLATFTPSNYYFAIIEMSIVKRGSLEQKEENTAFWKIWLKNDSFGGASNDFSIWMQRV